MWGLSVLLLPFAALLIVAFHMPPAGAAVLVVLAFVLVARK